MCHVQESQDPTDDARSIEATSCCGGSAPHAAGDGEATSSCPMSNKCPEMARKMRGVFGLLPILLGLALLPLAAFIVLEPQVLIWFAAAVVGLIGLAITGVSFAVRRALRASATV